MCQLATFDEKIGYWWFFSTHHIPRKNPHDILMRYSHDIPIKTPQISVMIFPLRFPGVNPPDNYSRIVIPLIPDEDQIHGDSPMGRSDSDIMGVNSWDDHGEKTWGMFWESHGDIMGIIGISWGYGSSMAMVQLWDFYPHKLGCHGKDPKVSLLWLSPWHWHLSHPICAERLWSFPLNL